MAQEADHILIGRVTGVDMIDGNGKPVEDREARTGPGRENIIRILITVDEVLVTNASDVPSVIRVPLASHLHYSLGQISEVDERWDQYWYRALGSRCAIARWGMALRLFIVHAICRDGCFSCVVAHSVGFAV